MPCERQILGEEARARVPAEFVAQHPDVANPPTLFLPLAAAAARLRAPPGLRSGSGAADAEAQDRAEDRAFLHAGAPKNLIRGYNRVVQKRCALTVTATSLHKHNALGPPVCCSPS